MTRSLKIAGAITLALLCAVAVAAAIDPAAVVALVTDPHVQTGLVLAETVAVDPEMVKAELKKLGDRVSNWMDTRSEKEKELQARLLELEQRAARRGSGDPGAPYDDGGAALRQLLDGSSELKAVADRKSRRAVIELPPGFFKAQIVSGGGLALPDTLPEIVAPVKRRFTIRGLIPSIPTSSGSVQYTRETSFTNAAASVSETTEKPPSTILFELKTSPIATIAHYVMASVQVLADTPQLIDYISNRLRYGLAYVEDLQLLKGSGVGSNLEGLLLTATAYNRTTGGDTKIDVLRRAITQLEDTDFAATGIVLHPFDWEKISLIKSTVGEYIVGSPGGANPATLWNLPVVSTSAMTENSFLVADFPQAALVFDREQARVDLSTEDEDNFKKNMVTIRGEERIGLATLRPGGLITGSF